MEAFNGQLFFDHTLANGGRDNITFSVSDERTALRTTYQVTVPAAQLVLLEESYGALSDYAYQSLAMQTRLSEFSDSIGLAFDGTTPSLQ